MTPLPRCSLLSLDAIDIQDTSYSLRPQSDTGPDQVLRQSIQKFGILQPPLVQMAHGHYIILSGRKRIQAAEALGWKEIPCLIVDKQAEPYQVCEIILIHAQTGATLSPIEQAVFFRKTGDKFTKEQAVALLPLIGIKPHPYKLQEFAASLQLDQTAVDALHSGLIQQKTGNRLSKLSGKDQQTVVGLIDHFKLGGSKQQKLVGFAIELGMRTGRPFRDFILKWQQEDTADDNRPQQASALLSSLEKQCFPDKSRAEEQFQQFRRSIELPENSTLLHTASFEDDRLTLSITFENQNSFVKGWEQIKKNL
ncbi:MAG: ParB/RepB/Spo0J family partition protein [Desulfobulbaceae bacterium]|nr:ParB/RepB/Spo0J family partition protein [Desulfobulbaceae bacterium]